MWGTGERGEGGIYRDSNMETYALRYAKQIAKGIWLCDSGTQTRAPEQPPTREGEGGGREVQGGGGVCIPIADSSETITVL